MSSRAVTVAVVGAGHRAVTYASYALARPDRMKVVAVADPDPARRDALAAAHAIPAAMRFSSFEDLAGRPPVADAVINGTMDRLHYASSLPLVRQGYHLLLEKPIAAEEAEVRGLIAAARAAGRTVMICHVLRYAPFYVRVKELLDAGAIGRIVSARTAELVSYHHMAIGFVRGKWSRRAVSNPMLLAKCCHDLDLLAWFFTGIAPSRVASLGALTQFRPENAPAGSTARCLGGCAIEATCAYSARLNYVVQGLWPFYAWEMFPDPGKLTEAEKLASLQGDNPYGRCVWRCDNDVVDHQSVLIQFANGATATHDMFCATARPTRTVHLVGEKGEIEGDLEAGRLVVRRPDPRPGPGYVETAEDLAVKDDPHGGGDLRLVDDFVSVLRGEPASRASTRIEDSLAGHLIAFAADRAMTERRVVEV